MISVPFQVKSFNITGIQVYAQSLTPKKLKLNGSIKIYKTPRIITQKKKKKNFSSGRLRQGGRGGGGPAVSLERGAAGLAAEDGELRKKYCVYCLAEVSPLRFRCAECQDIELCPCPGCFSAGAEIRHHHRRYHGYQLMDGGRFTLWGPEATGAGPAARSSCCWMPWSSSASGTGRTWQLTSALPGPPRK